MLEYALMFAESQNLVVWYALTNIFIAVIYLFISLLLYTAAVVSNFKIPLTYRNVLLAFACFIFGCGVSRAIGVLSIWIPWYWFVVVWNGLTCAASVVALALFFPLARRFMAVVRMEEHTNGKTKA